MDLKRKVAFNTIVQIIGKVVSTLLGVLALAIIARYLGVGGFGEYSTIINFVAFFAMSADLGLTLISAQMISNPQENQNEVLSNLFTARLISALILLGLAPLIVIFTPYSGTIKIGVLIAIISYLFPALNQILIALFQKTLKMERAMISEVAGRIFLILGLLLVLKFNKGLNGILWASAFSAAATFILNWLLGKKSAKIKLSFNWKVWQKIWQKTWPLATTIILSLVYQKGDILLLSFFKGVEEVGLYGAAHRAIEVISTLPYMFSGIMLPLFTVNWLNKNTDFLKKLIQKSLDFMIILALPLIVGAQFTAQGIISLVAGKDFAAGGLALQLLIVSTAILFVSCIFSHLIIAIDKQKKLIKLYIFTAISSLVLYLLLLEKFSYLGLAATTIYSNLLILGGAFYYSKKYTKFSPRFQVALRSLLAALAMGIFMYLIPPLYYQSNLYLILIIILSSLLYFLLLYILGGIKKEDLEIIIPKKIK